MNLSFANGNTAQQNLAQAVVSESRYPFDQVSINVTIEWADVHMEKPLSHSLWAGLTQQQPDGSWLIRLRTDLGDPSKPSWTPQLGNGGPDRRWFADVLIHELGHVMQGVLNTETAVVALFGGTSKDWIIAGSTDQFGGESSGFPRMIREGDAETFKDVFAGAHAYDNRTGWWLPRKNFDAWLRVYSPTGGGGGAFEYDYQFTPYFIG